MEMKRDRAIYLQIADHMMENILARKWKENDRIPSVRDMALTMEVNPNTVAHAYNFMNDKGIIYNQRGVGYFVATDAVNLARQHEKEDFLQEQLPRVFKRMLLLGIDLNEFKDRYEIFAAEAREEQEAEEK